MPLSWEKDVEANLENGTRKADTQRRSSYLIAILALVAVLVIAGLGYWWLQQNLAATVAEMESDVRATHRLLQDTIQQDDGELFRVLLSEQQPSWTGTQERLFKENLLLDRRPFGLHLVSAEPAGDTAVEISRNLQVAEVVSRYQYTHETEDSPTTITLQQTTVYRRVEERWLMTAPPESYWGEEVTAESEFLTLIAPEREQEVVQALASDLSATLADMCLVVTGRDCPPDFHLQVHMDSDPDTLLAVADIHTVVYSPDRLRLPAPTLVGLPTDDQGYHALHQGYASHVVIAGITELIDYECCRHGLYYRAYLEKQLSQLGLRPWPLTPTDYEQLLHDGPDYFETTRLRSQESLAIPEAEGWEAVFALVDFLVEEFPPELVRQSVAQGFEPFLTSQGYDIDRFMEEWSDFIASRSASD